MDADEPLLVHISGDNRRLDRVDRADPVIWLPDEALNILVSHHPDCDCGMHLSTEQKQRLHQPEGEREHVCDPTNFTGCRFVLEPTHGDRIVYVIKDYDWSRSAWRAAWPD